MRWHGVFAGIQLLSVASAAHAQRITAPPGPVDVLKNCPNGYRIQFVLRSATLFIEPYALGFPTLFELARQVDTNCPTVPVRMKDIVLGLSVAFPLSMPAGLEVTSGLGLMNLDVGDDAPTSGSGQSSSVPPPIAAMLSQPPHPSLNPRATEPWIEMPEQASDRQETRSYIVHYPSAQNTPAQLVYLYCTGPNGRRLCNAHPHIYSELRVSVSYTLMQLQLPAPAIPSQAQVASSDPSTEPGALLQFDTRLRTWLAQEEEPPK